MLEQFSFLYNGIAFLFSAEGWKNLVMFAIGGVLIYLALVKDFEPALLMPMGFGAILVNIPWSGAVGFAEDGSQGIVDWLFRVGIEASEAMPLLLFIGIGAMIDFGPLLSNPKMLLFGAAAQFGIFLTALVASLLPEFQGRRGNRGNRGRRRADCDTGLQDFESVHGRDCGAAVVYGAGADYQPFAIRLVTTKERMIRMPYNLNRFATHRFYSHLCYDRGLVAPESVWWGC